MAGKGTPPASEVEEQPAGSPVSRSYNWALTALLAALHFEVAMIPFSAAVGVGGVLTLGLMTGPIIGLLLGPGYGFISVLLGSLLLGIVNPASMVIGPFTPIATAMGAACAGALARRRYHFPALVYLAVVAVFLLGPGALGGSAALWFHVLGVALSLVILAPPFRRGITRGLESSPKSPGRLPAVWVAVFLSMMLDQVVGLTMFVYYYHFVIGLDTSQISMILIGIATVYPVERLVASLIASAIAIPVLAAVRQSGLPIPSRI